MPSVWRDALTCIPLGARPGRNLLLGWGFSWRHPNTGPTLPGFPFFLSFSFFKGSATRHAGS